MSEEHFERLRTTLEREFGETQKKIDELKQRELDKIGKETKELERVQAKLEEVKKEGAAAIAEAKARFEETIPAAVETIQKLRSGIESAPELEGNREELLSICDKISDGIHNRDGIDKELLRQMLERM